MYSDNPHFNNASKTNQKENTIMLADITSFFFFQIAVEELGNLLKKKQPLSKQTFL